MQVAIAASSEIAAAAGARIAACGGNAVDAAMAAALVSMTTEPGVVSLGGGGFVTIWADGQDPITIDGNVCMPGAGLPAGQIGKGAREVHLSYGGGVSTLIGHGTVATPGALATVRYSAQLFGKLPWRELVEPAWEHARDGFPLPQASYNYLKHSGECIYGWHADSHASLFAGGRLALPGERIHVPHLADSLRRIADDGVDAFYRGEIAALIIDDMQDNEGALTRADLEDYDSAQLHGGAHRPVAPGSQSATGRGRCQPVRHAKADGRQARRQMDRHRCCARGRRAARRARFSSRQPRSER